MMLSDSELARWRQGIKGAAQPLTLRVLLTEHPVSSQFEALAEALTTTLPEVRVEKVRGEGAGPPAVLLGERWSWQALPTGGKLELFLLAVAGVTGAPPALPPDLAKRLAGLAGGTRVEIFMAEQCPFCPGVIRQMIPLVFALPGAAATLTDGTMFPEEAEARGIRAVPTVIINDQHRLTGSLRVAEVVDLLTADDWGQLSAASLERRLKEGQAGELAAQMLARRVIFPGFLPLLTHSEWSVRLGAIVVVEDMAEQDLELAREVLGPIWEAFEGQDEGVKGDILYLVGELGEAEWIGRLEERLAATQDAETQELISETLESLRAAAGGA